MLLSRARRSLPLAVLFALLVVLPLPLSVWAQFTPSPSGIATFTSDAVPTACQAGVRLAVLVDGSEEQCKILVCNEAGTGYVCAAGTQGGGAASGQRPTFTDITTDATLSVGPWYRVLVPAGGLTLTLPSAAAADTGAPATATAYVIRIHEASDPAGILTLVADGTDTLLGLATPLTVSGRYAGWDVSLWGTTGWYVEAMAVLTELTLPSSAGAAPTSAGQIAYDTTREAPVFNVNGVGTMRVPGTKCTGANGSTNNSASGSGAFVDHDIVCTVEANHLQANSVFQFCSVFETVSGSSPPALSFDFLAGATALYGNATAYTTVANRTQSGALCVITAVQSAPGASVNLWTGNIAPLSHFQDFIASNGVNQPQTAATNASLTFKWRSKWAAVGTGTNTVQQIAAYMLILQ